MSEPLTICKSCLYYHGFHLLCNATVGSPGKALSSSTPNYSNSSEATSQSFAGHHGGAAEWFGNVDVAFNRHDFPAQQQTVLGSSVRPRGSIECSVVIPVYNSASMISETISRTAAAMEAAELSYEIILVNDGSTDSSWTMLEQEARKSPHVVAINLVKNYGQHPAVFCGLVHSSGQYVVTIDDDLQNPPEEIAKLLAKGKEGYDLVCGRFYSKRHELYRRLGSKLISLVNEKIFRKPRGYYLTNFRLMERKLVDRICCYKTAFPYVNGLAVLLSGKMANIWVEHHERRAGKSGYNLGTILKLVLTILFNYSSYPLRLVCAVGLGVSAMSFLLAVYFTIKAIFLHTSVPGWASIVTLLSFFNAFLTLMLGMLGEYTIRILATVANHQSYHVREIITFD